MPHSKVQQLFTPIAISLPQIIQNLQMRLLFSIQPRIELAQYISLELSITKLRTQNMRLNQVEAIAPYEALARLRDHAITVMQIERRIVELQPPGVEFESCGVDVR